VVSAISAARLVFGLIIIGGLLTVGVICAMKGKWVFFVLGWFSGIFWIVGASRLGKPNSYWARRRYGELELAEAQRRFSRRLLPRWGGWPFRDGAGRNSDTT
jgi:hypothetical protein